MSRKIELGGKRKDAGRKDIVMTVSDYDLGILWGTSSAIGDHFILRNKDRYFAERVQKINGGTIFELTHYRKGTLLYCLKIKRRIYEYMMQLGWEGRQTDDRIFPPLNHPELFVKGYIQTNSSCDLWTHRYRSSISTTPRLRIHGGKVFLVEVADVLSAFLGVTIKKVQTHSNGKMGVLYYQSKQEVIDILSWVFSGECSPSFKSKNESFVI